MRRILARLIVLFAVLLVCATGLTVTLVFLAVAGYFALAQLLEPPFAALAAAGGALLFTAIAIAIGQLALRRSAAPPENDSRRSRARAAFLLGDILGKEAMELADRYPGRTIAAGLLAGLAVGISPALRKSLWKMFRR